MPSDSMSTTASKSAPSELGVGRRPPDTARTARPRPTPRTRVAATICCASTSSGASRRRTASISARRAARTSAAHSTSWSRVSGNSRPLGVRPQRVARPPDALQARRDRARRSDQARQLDRADVDAQLERRGRDHDAQVAFLQPPLGAVAALARQAAVVGGDGLGAQPLAQVQRHALDQPARVDEHQRRPVLARQRRRCDRRARPTARWCTRRPARLPGPRPPGPDRGAGRRRRSSGSGRSPTSSRAATSSGRTVADSPTRCSLAGRHQRLQPLERQRQVRAALVGRDGVDLVDDHRPHVAQRAPARLRRQQDEQRFGRGDQHVRRAAGRCAPLARRRVAGAHGGADAGRRVAELGRRATRSSASGSSRLRRMSLDSAFSGDT